MPAVEFTLMTLEPIVNMPNVVTAAWRRLGVHVFEGRLTVDDMNRLEASGTAWHKKNPGKVVEMVIIYPSDARMNGDERARMAALIKRNEHLRTASATVVLATGLMGAMHRSVLTGMQMLAPPPHPTKVFGVTAEAVSWLGPYIEQVCGVDANVPDVLAGVEQLCAKFKALRAAHHGHAASG